MIMEWNIIFHIQIEMLDHFNQTQTEWAQTFNRNRQKFQNTKGPKTMCDLQFLGRWISFFLLNAWKIPKHFIPILSNYIFKFSWNKPWRENNKNNPLTPEQIRTVTSFIRQSLELREGDSSQSSLQFMLLYFLCSLVCIFCLVCTCIL